MNFISDTRRSRSTNISNTKAFLKEKSIEKRTAHLFQIKQKILQPGLHKDFLTFGDKCYHYTKNEDEDEDERSISNVQKFLS